MRVYLTVSVSQTEAIFRDGFTDIHSWAAWCGDPTASDCLGVFWADKPLNINDGYSGDVTLCLDIDDGEFERREVVREDGSMGYRLALIPATVLNGMPAPKVYDHAYAGLWRGEMLRAIRTWEEDAHGQRKAQELRAAMEFFDRIGWLTPVRVQEDNKA